MKKILMIFTVLFLFNQSVIAEVQYDEFGNVVEQGNEVSTTEVQATNEIVEINFPEYKKLLTTEETKFVFFYNYDCSECDTMRPFINEIVEKTNIKLYNLNTYVLSDEEQEELKKIKAFKNNIVVPTIIAIENKNDEKYISGFQYKESIEEFVSLQTKTADKKDEGENNILLYLIISLSVAIVLAIIGFFSTKAEENKKNKTI